MDELIKWMESGCDIIYSQLYVYILFLIIIIMHTDINVREQAAEFEKEDVTVILEWDELNSLHSVKVSVTPETQVNISSSTARLTMAYSIMYNVSVVVSHPCEQNSATVFTEMYYYPGEHYNSCYILF